jgi:hypothetical protein
VGTRFEKARFHVQTGPASLFDRIQFKLRGRRELKLNAGHLRQRAYDREAPFDLIKWFDADDWELMTAEVRSDTGKFVNSAWRRTVGGACWWIVIGLHDTLETVIRAGRKTGLGESVVRGGDLYRFVDRVNRDLMKRDEGINRTDVASRGEP